MKRRKFILLAAAGSAAVAIAGIECNSRPPAVYAVLEKPGALSRICDEQTIREIGLAYRLQKPEENSSQKLADALLTDSSGRPLSSSVDDQFVRTLISKKIELDFEKANMIVVRGWILAVTEARQCAFFAVQHQQKT